MLFESSKMDQIAFQGESRHLEKGEQRQKEPKEIEGEKEKSQR